MEKAIFIRLDQAVMEKDFLMRGQVALLMALTDVDVLELLPVLLPKLSKGIFVLPKKVTICVSAVSLVQVQVRPPSMDSLGRISG